MSRSFYKRCGFGLLLIALLVSGAQQSDAQVVYAALQAHDTVPGVAVFHQLGDFEYALQSYAFTGDDAYVLSRWDARALRALGD